jgi:hypothetical protein
MRAKESGSHRDIGAITVICKRTTLPQHSRIDAPLRKFSARISRGDSDACLNAMSNLLDNHVGA